MSTPAIDRDRIAADILIAAIESKALNYQTGTNEENAKSIAQSFSVIRAELSKISQHD